MPSDDVVRMRDLETDGDESRLEVLEREHQEFFERWHQERRRRESLSVLMQQVLSDAQAQDVLPEWWPILEVAMLGGDPDARRSDAENVGASTNPRYLLWRIWAGDSPSMRLWDYTTWNDKRWAEFCVEEKRNRRMLSSQDQADYDVQLEGPATEGSELASAACKRSPRSDGSASRDSEKG
jgi:hypothetical protein